MTPTAEKIMGWLGLTQSVGDLGVLRGQPGVGKSSALREFATRQAYGPTWLIELNQESGRKGGTLDAVCDALGVRESALFSGRGYHRVVTAIRRALSDESQERPGMIIFDEAQYMSREAVSIMRHVADTSRCAVFFAGNREVLDGGGIGNRSRFREAPIWTGELAQIKSRVGVWQEIDKVIPEDVFAYALAAGVPEDEAILNRLWSAAQQPGGLRNIEKLLRITLCSSESASFSAEAIEVAWALRGMDSARRFA